MLMQMVNADNLFLRGKHMTDCIISSDDLLGLPGWWPRRRCEKEGVCFVFSIAQIGSQHMIV